MRNVIATAAMILLAACTGSGERGSGVAGANAGLVIGSEVASGAGQVPLGAVQGGLLGADVGRSLNESDRQLAAQAEYEALEYGRAGRPARWRSSETGNRGEIVVGPGYEVNRLDCREYSHTVLIGGRPRLAKGTACRQPDSTWRIVG